MNLDEGSNWTLVLNKLRDVIESRADVTLVKNFQLFDGFSRAESLLTTVDLSKLAEISPFDGVLT